MKTTLEQRSTLRDLFSKTTEGKWTVDKARHGVYADKMCAINSDQGEVMGVRQLGLRQCREVEENAAFIAEVHSLILDLLDDIDELREKK